MQTLRWGAALATVLPAVSLRIQAGDDVLVEVRRPPFSDEGPRQIPVCGFRSAVTRAHSLRSAGQDLGFLSLPEGVDPSIDVGLTDGLVLPGGIVRSTQTPRWVHVLAIASALDPRQLAAGAGLQGLGCHYDRDLDVMVFHTATPVGDVARSARAVDQLTEALARCAVAELEAFVAR